MASDAVPTSQPNEIELLRVGQGTTLGSEGAIAVENPVEDVNSETASDSMLFDIPLYAPFHPFREVHGVIASAMGDQPESDIALVAGGVNRRCVSQDRASLTSEIDEGPRSPPVPRRRLRRLGHTGYVPPVSEVEEASPIGVASTSTLPRRRPRRRGDYTGMPALEGENIPSAKRVCE